MQVTSLTKLLCFFLFWFTDVSACQHDTRLCHTPLRHFHQWFAADTPEKRDVCQMGSKRIPHDKLL